MKLGLWLRLIWMVGAYCGCGGSEFLVGVFPDGGGPVVDAGAVEDAPGGDEDAHPAMTTDGSSPAEVIAHHDAGELAPPEHDAGAVDSPAPAADSASSPGAPDASDEPTPPPPALCCLTPCSGSSVAPIACGNGPDWTCSSGSCADRACAAGAVCNWMGATCTGRVGVCP